MKFTNSFPDAVVCCLLALPISWGQNWGFSPYCSSNGADGCECDKQRFHCDPFGPDVCGSIYMSPDEPNNKVNVPMEVAKDAVAATKSIFAVTEGDPVGLIKLPFKFVNNGKPGDNNYDVDPAFVDAMKLNVQNYVAQKVSQAQMENLYEGIVGNNDAFGYIARSYDNFVLDDTNKVLQEQLNTAIQDQILALIRDYPKYASKTPTINPTITPTGSTTGANGWGIYYSVFVNQLLLAFLQDIAVTGTDHLADSITSQQSLVKYGWMSMKHAGELIDTYVVQRESGITGPTSRYDKDKTGYTLFEIQDSWAFYHEGSPQTCSWGQSNSYDKNIMQSGGYIRQEDCDQLTVDFVKTYSIHCKEGRK